MYYKPDSSEVYRSLFEVIAFHPLTSFPPTISEDILGGVGVFPIQQVTPDYDPITHGARERLPTLLDGKYVQQWEIYPLDAETVAANKDAEARRIRREIMDGVQRYLDDFATTRTYDSMLSACTYATSTVPQFAREGQYCVQMRDECWAIVARIEAEVLAGTRPEPAGFDDIKGELPALEWPQ